MENIWLKIKVWTKITVFSAAVIYLLFFVFENANIPLKIWVWFGQEIDTSLLKLIPSLLAAGVLGTLLTRTVLRTIRQWRELRARGRAKQLEKDMALIKSRAAMLQTKPQNPPSQIASATPPTQSPPASPPPQ